MRRLSVLTAGFLAAVCAASCGLADDPREEDKRHEYLTISDPAFAAWCLREADADGDGRISRYEAERMVSIDCSDCGIASLRDLGDFPSLRELNCRGNRLTELDLRVCPDLRRADCSFNGLRLLDAEGLRGLAELDCAGNELTRLDLLSDVSLRALRCSSNSLSLLNVSDCAASMDEVDARDCPLGVFYMRRGQSIRLLLLDDPDVVKESY